MPIQAAEDQDHIIKVSYMPLLEIVSVCHVILTADLVLYGESAKKSSGGLMKTFHELVTFHCSRGCQVPIVHDTDTV